MLTNISPCPVRPYLGVQLQYIPLNFFRDILNRHYSQNESYSPEFLDYCRSKFSQNELDWIILEGQQVVQRQDELLTSMNVNTPSQFGYPTSGIPSSFAYSYTFLNLNQNMPIETNNACTKEKNENFKEILHIDERMLEL